MDWSKKKVLVTGAGGFIGSHLTERLVELGAETKALVRYTSNGTWGWLDESAAKGDVEVILGDIRDSDSVNKAVADADIVFHLAALIGIPYSYDAPISYVRTNIEGTLNVLQAAMAAKVERVVHTSTSEVYGTAQYVPIDEAHPLQGQSPYSASKIGADKIAESFYLSFGLPVTVVRPFNTYGPRQSARAVIPTIITQTLADGEVRLGSTIPTRDLNFVADTVSGFIRAAETPAAIGEIINLGTGREISVGDLAKEIMRLIGREAPIVCEETRVRPQNSEVERLLANNQKAQDILDWRPEHELEVGLEKTIEWIRSNLDRYRLGAYIV